MLHIHYLYLSSKEAELKTPKPEWGSCLQSKLGRLQITRIAVGRSNVAKSGAIDGAMLTMSCLRVSEIVAGQSGISDVLSREDGSTFVWYDPYLRSDDASRHRHSHKHVARLVVSQQVAMLTFSMWSLDCEAPSAKSTTQRCRHRLNLAPPWDASI